MADLVYILITIAFFALCVGYVGFADRIIQRGETDPVARTERTRTDRRRGDRSMSADNIVGLVVAVALIVYLVIALLDPERF